MEISSYFTRKYKGCKKVTSPRFFFTPFISKHENATRFLRIRVTSKSCHCRMTALIPGPWFFLHIIAVKVTRDEGGKCISKKSTPDLKASIEKWRQGFLVLMTSENVEKRRTEKADTRISLVIKVKTWSDKRQMQHSKHLTVLGARTNFLWIINFDGTFSAWTRTKYILRAQTEEKLRELNQTVSLSRSSQSLLWLIKLCVFQFHNSSCVRNFSRNERLPRRIGLQPPTKSESLKTRHIKKKIQLNRKTIKSWVISISLVELIFFHPVFCVNLLELFSFPWNSVSVSSSTTHLLFGCLAWIAEEQLNLRGQKVLRIITGFRGSLARYENTWGIQSYSKLQCTITKSWGKYWNKVRREENNSKACCALFIFFNSRKRERRNLFLYFVSRLSRVFVSFYSPTQIADHKKAKFPSCQSPQQAQ